MDPRKYLTNRSGYWAGTMTSGSWKMGRAYRPGRGAETESSHMNYEQWYSFKPGAYTHEIDVRDFIQRNYTPYTGGPEFLAPATGRNNRGIGGCPSRLKTSFITSSGSSEPSA